MQSICFCLKMMCVSFSTSSLDHCTANPIKLLIIKPNRCSHSGERTLKSLVIKNRHLERQPIPAVSFI